MCTSETYLPGHQQFHEWWTKTVGAPGYDKRAWLDLDRRLSEAHASRNHRAVDRILRDAERLYGEQAGN